jgi:hypothetical protein
MLIASISSAARRKEIADMIAIPSTAVVIALGALAVVLLALLAKLCLGKPKRAEKWEKAQIMKQLLALSERENGLARTASSVRMRPPASRPAMRPGNAHLKATAKTTLPNRSKTR